MNQVKRLKASEGELKMPSAERKRSHKKSKLLAQVEDMFKELENDESEQEETTLTDEMDD